LSIGQINFLRKNKDQLIEDILEKGLPFVASYLEKEINRPILITDNSGKIHYSGMKYIENTSFQFPSNIKKGNYYFNKKKNCLYYPIECRGTNVYIIVKNLTKELVGHTIAVLSSAKLAIKCYFLSLNSIHIEKDYGYGLKRLDGSYYFSNQINISEITAMLEKRLDNHKLYFVEIIESDTFDPNIDWQAVYSYALEYLKKTELDIISMAWPNRLVIFVSATCYTDSQEINPDWPKLINKLQAELENTFNIVLSKGIGQVYPSCSLAKSYQEACISLTLSRLIGKRNFVQRFSDLGFFSLIFSHDTGTLYNYCLKSLAPLLDYDKKTNGELLTTLRILLDSSFNYKQTADSLYIHVNTLYYRIERIEKLLGVNLSQMDIRLNLYAAIKVWDLLNIDNL